MSPQRRGPEEPSLFRADAALPRAAALDAGRGAPMATRMRPRTLDEVLGQGHLLAPGSILRTMIEQDRLRSVILFGPAGTGKTSLAALVARHTSAEFVQLSAVSAGVADVRRIVEEGRQRLDVSGRRTVLFIDEVHRFNKAQQDVLLPGVEAGWVVFIGATTENPFFSLIGPLRSRSTLFRLEALSVEDVREIMARAVSDERGLAGRFEVDAAAVEHVVARAEGDARVALNALEAAAERAAGRGERHVTEVDAEDAMRQRFLHYDRAGDQHYDVISAFIKSMRGSDPDAAVAWLVRMLEAGDDARFIARRMVIFASEDIGMADPHALQVAVAAAHAVELVGLPEAEINLAHAAIALSLAPKSNAVIRAIGAAREDLSERGQGDVPEHLRNIPTPGRSRTGVKRYKYPHDSPEGWVPQQYHPEGLGGRRYWNPEPRLGLQRPGEPHEEEPG